MKTYPLVLLSALLLSACSSHLTHATFVTKTSLAVLDADNAPAGISIAFDRVEGYVGPRLEDGKVLPVVGVIETDGGVLIRDIRQIYATGRAAELVAAHAPGAAAAAPPAQAAPPATTRDVLFFGTGTNIGLKIGFQAGTALPNSFNLGYRRKEISVIPVDQGHLPAVFARIDNAPAVKPVEGGRPDVRFGLTQYFATGVAAEQLAAAPGVGGALAARISREEGFRKAEADQAKNALDLLFCLSRLPDAQLDRVWTNAEDLAVFDTFGTMPRVRAAAPDRQRQRQIYTGDVGLLNADSAQFGARLSTHREVVCRLAPKP